MKDNDIKKIIDSAIESDAHTDIDTEKIQNTVMERLEKQAGDNFKLSDSEKAVEPVFVTAPVKKSRKIPAVIAAAAAVCLGITAVSTGFFGIRSNLSTLTNDISDTAKQTDLSESETAEAYIAEKTPDESETAKATEAIDNIQEASVQSEDAEIKDKNPEETPAVSYESWEDHIGKKYPLKNNCFTLLDGTEVVVEEDIISNFLNQEKADWLISEDKGRVYYWNGREKKDITDLMSTETPYIDSYENEESGLTHYIVIGGDVASGKYGYAEIFATHERSWHFEMVCNREELTSETDEEQRDKDEKEVKRTVLYLVKAAVEQVSGESIFEYGGGTGWTDLKSVTLPCDR